MEPDELSPTVPGCARDLRGPRPGAGRWSWSQALGAYLLVVLPMAFLWLGALDVHVMEGIVADGARHMARTRSYAVPHLHGEVYLYKPPMAAWLALVSTGVFGQETAFTLRFLFASSAVLLGAAVLWMVGRAFGHRLALASAMASVTGALLLQKLHLAEFDLPLAAGVGVATAAACVNLAARAQSRLIWFVGYLGLAFGFLAKGPPALVFYFPGLAAAALVLGRTRRLRSPGHLAAAGLFMLIVAAWVAAAIRAVGWGPLMHPLTEVREKGLEWTWPALGHAVLKPAVALTLFLPWTLLLPHAADRGWRRALPDRERRLFLAALAFTAIGLLAFTLVPARQTRYFLPLAAPLGIVCGLILTFEPDSKTTRVIRVSARVLAGLLGLGLLVMPFLSEQFPVEDVARRALGVVVGLATLALALWQPRRLGGNATPALLLAVAVSFWTAEVAYIQPRRIAKRTQRPIAEHFEPHLEPGEPLWTTPVSKGFRHSSLAYYLRRPMLTMTSERQPQAGDHLVLFGDEPTDPDYRLPVRFEVIAEAESRGVVIQLCRVVR